MLEPVVTDIPRDSSAKTPIQLNTGPETLIRLITSKVKHWQRTQPYTCNRRSIMTMKLKTATAAFVFAVALGSGSSVFAKAHDQGVADGEATPDNTGALVQTLDRGVSSLVNNGARGAGASAAGSDNSVDPVVGNGSNVEPD